MKPIHLLFVSGFVWWDNFPPASRKKLLVEEEDEQWAIIVYGGTTLGGGGVPMMVKPVGMFAGFGKTEKFLLKNLPNKRFFT